MNERAKTPSRRCKGDGTTHFYKKPLLAGVRPLFLMACAGRIMDAANTRKNKALGASVMRRSATPNPIPKFRGRTRWLLWHLTKR